MFGKLFSTRKTRAQQPTPLFFSDIGSNHKPSPIFCSWDQQTFQELTPCLLKKSRGIDFYDVTLIFRCGDTILWKGISISLQQSPFWILDTQWTRNAKLYAKQTFSLLVLCLEILKLWLTTWKINVMMMMISQRRRERQTSGDFGKKGSPILQRNQGKQLALVLAQEQRVKLDDRCH